MPDFETSALRPLSSELRRRARRERSLVVNVRSAVRSFVESLGALAARLTHSLAAERQRRHAIRALQRFDDRALEHVRRFPIRVGFPNQANSASPLS